MTNEPTSEAQAKPEARWTIELGGISNNELTVRY